MVTRQSLRRALGQDLAGEHYVLGTLASATTTGATIAELADTGSDAGVYRDRWLWFVTAEAERRIITYTPGTGAVVWHRVLGSAPSGSVEAHRWPPSLMHVAINDGLWRCKYLDEQEITPVANQTVYSLASYTYLVEPKQVLRVELERDNGSGNKYREEVAWWKVRQDSTTLCLWIDPPVQQVDDTCIVLTVKRGYGPLNDETTTSITIDDLWSRAAVRVQMLKQIIARTSPGRERDRYEEMLGEAIREFRRQSKLHQVKESHRLRLANPVDLSTISGRSVTYWNP